MDHSRTFGPDLHQHQRNVQPFTQNCFEQFMLMDIPDLHMPKSFHYQERLTELFGTWMQNQNFCGTILGLWSHLEQSPKFGILPQRLHGKEEKNCMSRSAQTVGTNRQNFSALHLIARPGTFLRPGYVP